MTYERPESLDSALAALAPRRPVVLAGCTDLYPATQEAALHGSMLDITALPELQGIARVADGWRIGACTTWSAIREAVLPPAFAALQQAAGEVGGRQIQSVATIAGNLCNASPAADGVPPLLVLDARVELFRQGGRREVPLAAFMTGPRRTSLRPDELVASVLVPDAALRGRSTFRKLGARRYLVISIAMVAARLEIEHGVIRDAALAVGACGPVATRLPRIEAALVGAGTGTAAARIAEAALAEALDPIDDVRASAEYRVAAAAELLRRAVADLGAAA